MPSLMASCANDLVKGIGKQPEEIAFLESLLHAHNVYPQVLSFFDQASLILPSSQS